MAGYLDIVVLSIAKILEYDDMTLASLSELFTEEESIEEELLPATSEYFLRTSFQSRLLSFPS